MKGNHRLIFIILIALPSLSFSYNPQNDEGFIAKKFNVCLWNSLVSGDVEGVAFEKCIDYGIDLCNVNKIQTSKDNVAVSPYTGRLLLDNGRCAQMLDSHAKSIFFQYNLEFSECVRREEIGIKCDNLSPKPEPIPQTEIIALKNTVECFYKQKIESLPSTKDEYSAALEKVSSECMKFSKSFVKICKDTGRTEDNCIKTVVDNLLLRLDLPITPNN